VFVSDNCKDTSFSENMPFLCNLPLQYSPGLQTLLRASPSMFCWPSVMNTKKSLTPGSLRKS
jgi:hypothetical protein